MSNEINLYSHQKKGRFSQEQVLLYSKILAIFFSILTVSMAITLFVLNRDPALSQLQAQQQTLLTQLTLLHTKTAKDLIILDRIKRIAKINQNRNNLDQKIAMLQKQLPSSITISSLTITNDHLVMTLSAESLVPIGTFIESATADIHNKELLKKLTIEGVTSDEKTGSYLLSISSDLL